MSNYFDDLESLGYMLLQVHCGELIWAKYSDKETLSSKKELLSRSNSLCPAIEQFLRYVHF